MPNPLPWQTLGDGLTFNVLPASAQTVDGKWSVNLTSFESPLEFKSVSDFENHPKLKEFLKNNNELVLFILAHVTQDQSGSDQTKNDFIVIGQELVPERNLLDVVYRLPEENGDKLDEGMTRHIFFFTVACSVPAEAVMEPNSSSFDPLIMKGVTLYRIKWDLQENDTVEFLFKNIKRLVGKGSQSALSFYKELNHRLSTDPNKQSLVSTVPSGRSGAASSSDSSSFQETQDYALLLVSSYCDDKLWCLEKEEVESDIKCVKNISTKLRNTLFIYINEDKELVDERGIIGKARLKKCMEEQAKKISDGGYIGIGDQIYQLLQRKRKPIGRIWFFISGHGDEKGLILSKSERIGLRELAEPFFTESFKDTTKVFVVGACRGPLPRELKQGATQADNSCDAKYGLMFRNKSGDDAWPVCGLKRCFVLYGSVPGFKAYRPLEGRMHPNLLFKSMELAAERLKTRTGLLDFAQDIQSCFKSDIDKNQRKDKLGALSDQFTEIVINGQGDMESTIPVLPALEESELHVPAPLESSSNKRRRTSETFINQKKCIDQVHAMGTGEPEEDVEPRKRSKKQPPN